MLSLMVAVAVVVFRRPAWLVTIHVSVARARTPAGAHDGDAKEGGLVGCRRWGRPTLGRRASLVPRILRDVPFRFISFHLFSFLTVLSGLHLVAATVLHQQQHGGVG